MKSIKPTIISMVLIISILTAGILPSRATVSTTAPHVSVSPEDLSSGRQFAFSGLPINGIKTAKGADLTVRGVQTFAYTPDKKYVFTSSQCDKDDDCHTLLCRCSLPKSGDKAEFIHSMVLEGHGHGDSITITQRDLKKEIYDIWVACTANGSAGTEVARITYKVTGDTGIITKRVVLRDFAKSNVVNKKWALYMNGTDVLSVRKVSVYADPGSNQIMFRINHASMGRRSNYVIYDLKGLTAFLDKNRFDSKFSMKKAARFQKANIRSSLCPLDSYQSVSIDGRNLYMCGGNKNIGAQIYKIPYKISKNGASSEVIVTEPESVIDVAPEIPATDYTPAQTNSFVPLEIEGLQTYRNGKNTDYYINYYYTFDDIVNKVSVYKFTL